jgi:hypothetical protein
MVDFRVIEGGGQRRNADQDIADKKFADALREAAANFLRIIRGAGKPAALIQQCNDMLRAAVEFREAAGHMPPSTTVSSVLAVVEDEADAIFAKLASGEIKQELVDRWDDDGTFDRMYAEGAIQRGALQIIASTLLNQSIQVAAGKSEMHEGIRRVIAARERHRKIVEANSTVKVIRKKRDRKSAPRRDEPGQGTQ